MKGRVMSTLWDLVFVLVLTGAAFGIVVLAPAGLAPLRVMLGFLLVLALPGYALSAMLFPAGDDVDGVERLVLTVGLSMVLLPLIGVVLHYSWGLGAISIAAALTAVTVMACFVAWLRRLFQMREGRFIMQPDASFSRGLVVGLVGFGLALSVIGLVNRPALITEFYLVGREGGMEAYPLNVAPGGMVQFEAVIVNREGRTMHYELRLPAALTESESVEHVSLAQGEVWRAVLTPRAPDSVGRTRFPLELYRVGDLTPYRVVYLYLDVG